ncbi:hypothetical protein COT72_01525 [archaeon CG10_big_fil_rev_8_21_14_0_10_43_11]|nr:MAG: hypothetical protein COT72_01525 [archaeon CG10_big_fil_rev_8_21_14_0_10_43_11]
MARINVTIADKDSLNELYTNLGSSYSKHKLIYTDSLSLRDFDLSSKQASYTISSWRNAFFDWKQNESRSPSNPTQIRVPKHTRLYFLAPHYYQKHRKDKENYLNTNGVFFIDLTQVSVLTLDEITDTDAQANGFEDTRELQGIMITLAKKPTPDTLYTLFWHDPHASKNAFEQAQKQSVNLETCVHQEHF